MRKKFPRRIEFATMYNRKDKLNKDGEALIQIRAYQEGEYRLFSTGVYIAPHYWDNRNNRVKTKAPGALHLNRLIQDLLNDLQAFEHREVNRKGFCRLQELVEYARSEEPAQKEIETFSAFCWKELTRPTIKLNTVTGQKSSLKVLHGYRKVILFEDLTYRFINEYDRYLHRRYKNKNTMHKHHRVLKTYINLAIKFGYIPSGQNPYDRFTPQRQEPKRVFLSLDELREIEALTFPRHKSHLEQIKDMFLMTCYTGLRVSDLISLAPVHIERGNNGLELHKRMEKTEKILRLPLRLLFKKSGKVQSEPERIIQRNLARRKGKNEHYPIFKVTEQYYNRELKTLASMAGINKRLTSHVGRRTFSTILSQKVNPTTLKELLRHSDIKTTMLYVKLGGRDIDRDLINVNWD